MTGPQSNSTKPAPWYKHRWPWILMSGPAAVVVAGFYTFYLAKTHADEMVTDDYYKEGKYINLQIERDEAAAQRHIQAQVLFNNDGTAAKIFISGDFDKNTPMQLLLLHPAKKAYDQTVPLKASNAPPSGDKTEYTAAFNALPPAVHWYLRLEDTQGKWRVESKWEPKAGNAAMLMPKFDEMSASGAGR